MDKMIKNGDMGCFYWEPESMGGYDMGAWDESSRKPTVMMDAFLGIKHTEVSWLMKASMAVPTQEQSVDVGDLELQARIQHQRKGRIQSVDFYFDNKKIGTHKVEDLSAIGTTISIPFAVADATIGVHTAWAKAADTSKNTQTTDTVTFYVGQSTLFDGGAVENGEQKGGTARWDITFASVGKYRLSFKYSSTSFRGVKVELDGDSITKGFFQKYDDSRLTIDIDVKEAGSRVLQLTATSATGLPEISSLRIFPLEGQAVPSSVDMSGIDYIHHNSGDEMVGMYSLSGMFIRSMPQSQLGFSLGLRSSAVVVLPNCVGGTPYIVRKQRLK